MAGTVKQIIERAHRLIKVLAEGEQLTAPQVQDALLTFRNMLDFMSMQGIYVYAVTTETFALGPTFKESYLWGPGQDFATEAPVSVMAAHFKEPGGTNYPLELLDRNWWHDIAYSGNAERPVGFWFIPGSPNATIRFGNIPIDELFVVSSAKRLTNTQSLIETTSFPPGWDLAIGYMLAEHLAPEYGYEIQPNSLLYRSIRKARGQLTAWATKPASIKYDPGVVGHDRMNYDVRSGPY